MLQAMFSGVSGLQVHQTKLDVIGNNIANVNTVGFKAGRVSFEDQLSQTLRASTAPTDTVGGQNPAQVGLGVALGAVDTLQTQGNLQTTGKLTDLAIQGNGFFLVGSGSDVSYTRDGSFDLDSDGVLVNPANGLKLLGYVADVNGNIDTTTQISNDSVLKIPVGTLTSVKQTTQSTFQGNLDASAALRSTQTTITGNVTADPTIISTTTYDELGNAHNLALTLSGKTTSAGNDTWNATANIDGATFAGGPYNVVFDTATGAFVSSSLPATLPVTGTNGAANFTLALNVTGLTGNSAAPASAVAKSDGQTGGSPVWNTSLKVYDSLGVSHVLNFKFTRDLVGTGSPSPTAGQWSWTATEAGKPVATSASAGNNPLYFDSDGNLLDKFKQNLTLTPPTPGASPINMSVDFSTLTQLAGDSSVAATVQDGFPVGTLQSFTISAEGLITGIFSNGQSRKLGEVAVASFSNPAGLEKIGGNQFKESSNSGLAQVGAPNAQGRGKINTGYVEMSNVDLSTEFTNLIVTQRGFQANTKIITTIDDLLQEVINLKR